jgi:hypothetical protein
VISCGSFSPNGTSQDINLGYEPQWMLIKRTAGARDWFLVDNMRGWTANSASDNSKTLNPNLSAAETDNLIVIPTATGFTIPALSALNNDAHIYIAIRRGPMKVPTDATKVFAPVTRTATGADANITGIGFPPDFLTSFDRTGNSGVNAFFDRLRGPNNFMSSASTDGEASGTGGSPTVTSFNMDGISVGPDTSYAAINFSTRPYVNHYFRRAPGFFDVVCYTGTGVIRTVAHNLAAVPQMIIVKSRNISGFWPVYAEPMGNQGYVLLDATDAKSLDVIWDSTSPTSQVFSLAGPAYGVNDSGGTYVAYLFASAPGVSKVGSFTGTGATQVINCGFTGGARFVLIKATSTTGNWLVWDSARGIVAGNDPYLALNSTAAEVTNTDWVDTAATGFELSNAGGNLANSSGVSYVFLAVA